jgi:hypothetical protein
MASCVPVVRRRRAPPRRRFVGRPVEHDRADELGEAAELVLGMLSTSLEAGDRRTSLRLAIALGKLIDSAEALWRTSRGRAGAGCPVPFLFFGRCTFHSFEHDHRPRAADHS